MLSLIIHSAGWHMKIDAGGESISAETYRTLRARILSGQIAPGTKVTTPQLCKSLGASLGAVREALSRLRAEGLISAEAHRGYRVTPISVDDLRDLTRIRVEVECLCLERSMSHGTLEWEGGVVASAHLLARAHLESQRAKAPQPALQDLHRSFHRALVGACDSPRLLRLREQLFDEAERYRFMDFKAAPNRDAASEHAQIAEAALARDAKRARRLMTEHISRTADDIVNAMSVAAPSRRKSGAGRRAGQAK